MAMFVVKETANLTIIVITAIFCLIPLFAISSSQLYHINGSNHSQRIAGNIHDRDVATTAPFFVILIPAADLLLDFRLHILAYFYPDKVLKRPAEKPVVVRLTDFERLLFIIGVAIQSSVSVLPLTANLNTLSIVYTCTNNSSALLVLGPILVFLGRCTTTFSQFRIFIILFLAAIGLFFLTITHYFPTNSLLSEDMYVIGGIFVSASGLLYMVGVLTCALKCLYLNFGTEYARRFSIKWLGSFFLTDSTTVFNVRKSAYDDDINLYRNYIPALHMTSTLIIAFANIIAKYASNDNASSAYKGKSHAVLIGEILVLVIELRIRKNEIARGLVSPYSDLILSYFSLIFSLLFSLYCIYQYDT